jgi:hypothetical protein
MLANPPAMQQTGTMGTNALQFIAEHQTQLWSLGTVIFGALVTRLLRLKAKLLYSVDHSTNMLVDQPLLDQAGTQISPNQIVRTASVTVQNTGLIAAKGVEVTFNWKPAILNLLPARAFNEANSAFNRYSLKFDSFAPGERVTIDIMSLNAELPIITSVRSDDCVGKLITMTAQRVWPQWYLSIVTAILLLGALTFVYLTISLVQFFAR